MIRAFAKTLSVSMLIACAAHPVEVAQSRRGRVWLQIKDGMWPSVGYTAASHSLEPARLLLPQSCQNDRLLSSGNQHQLMTAPSHANTITHCAWRNAVTESLGIADEHEADVAGQTCFDCTQKAPTPCFRCADRAQNSSNCVDDAEAGRLRSVHFHRKCRDEEQLNLSKPLGLLMIAGSLLVCCIRRPSPAPSAARCAVRMGPASPLPVRLC